MYYSSMNHMAEKKAAFVHAGRRRGAWRWPAALFRDKQYMGDGML